MKLAERERERERDDAFKWFIQLVCKSDYHAKWKKASERGPNLEIVISRLDDLFLARTSFGVERQLLLLPIKLVLSIAFGSMHCAATLQLRSLPACC